tara:strand:- start:1162 stop:1332 length:171 start_codon:yes stop_codon:yes gene_type:complete
MEIDKKELRFRAFCIDHDWEGMSQINRTDAELDLEEHKKIFTDETHDHAGIHEIEI